VPAARPPSIPNPGGRGGQNKPNQQLTPHTLFPTLCTGGENGFNQAIELSADTLANVKFVQEKRLISKFFDEIAQDTGRYIFGVADTLACLEMGAVETLLVYEALDVVRYTVMNSVSGAAEVKLMTPAQASAAGAFRDEATGAELEVQESVALLEWLAENYKKFGCTLEFVTNKSQEGSQFCRGFGGIGGLLRYAVDPAQFEAALDDLDNGPVWDSDEDI
jgi:peptide chain release factor subunit 1